jgi:hypothetical protein
MKLTRRGVALAALFGLLSLLCFYSLAIHMRWRLGAWPTSIGTAGFPASLIVHGQLAWLVCSCQLLLSVFIVPAMILVCLAVRRWRRNSVYFALYSALYAACWGLMLLAPSPFLNWWWD